MSERLGVVGLGAMGSAMARTLAHAGFTVVGVDPMPEAGRRVGDGVTVRRSVAELFDGGDGPDYLVLSLPSSAEVETVIEGEAGVLALAGRPLAIIDTSTADPLSTRRLAPQLAAAGHWLVDAPVSGGPAGAASGSLVAFVGGETEGVERVRPVLDALVQRFTHVGGPGAGHVAKLVNNLLCAAHLEIAGEALAMIGAADLDAEQVLQAVNSASGRSGVTEVNLPRWVLSGTYDSGFTAGLMAKDVALATAFARSLGLDLPAAGHVDQSWSTLAESAGRGADFNRMADPGRVTARGGSASRDRRGES